MRLQIKISLIVIEISKSKYNWTKVSESNDMMVLIVCAPLLAAACISFTPFFTAAYIVEWLILHDSFSNL